MSRYSSLEKKARESILQQMDELGEITTDAVMELIRPHYIFDIKKLRNQALKRTANNLMRKYKDDKGIRTCFNYKDNGISKYVNVDKTKDLKALENIEIQLNKKYKGLNVSKKKVTLRKQILSGQLSIKDIDTKEVK
ncbi:hypothetical protein [Clostridium tyrobutyricum]|jgi:hypothetical protein|uniref:hypothetical protein n=1 Tax=Clostridium tyrobutyricum TaxID=1519 RepID=UPI0010AB3244|nr:hypothetical protein [Clostridium tyrobutyricum]MBV4427117.1 hypothetical protein [Clostridium tyrobutyricum]MBV4440139.1 hypothetical protein [Clostridium tyrobutyricum]MBV4442156.1 hypothetical protein [Clostridium tyrobutyricum]MBV4442273.1 hypothetical protein [Clostridium tyrobutyricum]QCH27329.1 hypothetical protein EZN00_00924 [Clostridium tyrobutyricum]